MIYSKEKGDHMDDIYTLLETRINALVQHCKTLQESNAALQQSQTVLLRENALLAEKNQGAITQLETMLARLKRIESTL